MSGSAADAFAEVVAGVKAQLANLEANLAEDMSEAAPNWSDVCSLRKVHYDLVELNRFLSGGED